MSFHVPPSFILSPSPYAKTLVETLQPFAKVKRILPRRRLYVTIGKNHYCYLLLKGHMSIHRGDNDLMLGTLKAPSITGMGNLISTTSTGYIKMISACDIGVMTIEEAKAVIDSANLWELLAKHTILVQKKLLVSSQQLMASSAYKIVCLQLIELMSEDEKFRASVAAEAYIRDKTNLSRSSIMRILSGLREGGYIDMRRGVLWDIHNLPPEF